MASKTIEVKGVRVKALSNGYNAIIESTQKELFTKWCPDEESAKEEISELHNLGSGNALNLEYDIKDDKYKNWTEYEIVKGTPSQPEVELEDADIVKMLTECYEEAKTASGWTMDNVEKLNPAMMASMITDIGISARKLLDLRLGR